LSLGRDISEILSHGGRNLDAQLFAQIMTMFNRRTTPQTKDEAVPRHVIFADLIDLHDTSKVLSGTADIIQVEDWLGYGVGGYRKSIPSLVTGYELVHDNSGASGITFPFHGVTEGDSGPVTTIGRRFGGCGKTNGSSVVTIDDTAQLDITDFVTLCGWIYTGANVSTFQYVTGKGNNTTTDPYSVSISSGNLRARVFSGGTLYTAQKAISINTWYHFVMTFSNVSNRVKMYLDKVAAETVTAGSLGTNGLDFAFFAKEDGFVPMLTGSALSWVSLLNFEANQAWVDDHFDGILVTRDNKEVTTMPFIDNLTPMSDSFSGMFQG